MGSAFALTLKVDEQGQGAATNWAKKRIDSRYSELQLLVLLIGCSNGQRVI